MTNTTVPLTLTLTDRHGIVAVTVAPGIGIATDEQGRPLWWVEATGELLTRHEAVLRGLVTPADAALTSEEVGTLLGTDPRSIRRFGATYGIGKPPRSRGSGEWSFDHAAILTIATRVRRVGRPATRARSA